MTCAIGIDFGGTRIKSGLVCNGEIIHHGEPIDTQACGSPERIMDALVDLVAKFGEQGHPIAGMGIGLPGIVDSVGGVVHELTNVSGWNDVPLREILQKRILMPVTIENDANAMAYGEFKFGAAKGGRHVVCITLGTGVGGALILNGQLYRGAQLGAGEIGHMSIDYKGKVGPYGNNGGLEEYVGNVQIAERAVALYATVGQAKTMDDCTPAQLAEAAQNGDVIALHLWDEIGTELGAALASVVWILNPDTIVLGGGVAKAGDVLFNPTLREIRARTVDVFHERLQLVPAALGNDAGIIGNAALALEAAAAQK